MSDIRLRFAPSPTGWLHIGSLHTVLFTYFITKNLGGKLVLRVEDTDQKREVVGAVEGLIDILNWVGIDFNEGPHRGGNYGPYIQSQRLDIYRQYAEELLQKSGAYHCFCTAERLEKLRADQTAQKLPPRYDRCCRDLSPADVAAKIKAGEKYVIRQALPLEGEVVAHDELRGDIKFKAADLDDQVLIKSDGVPTYQFASVVDDHLMNISHVTRAEEWIPSFPKNILLYRAFGWIPPKFIHFTVILNKTGGKLSKRQGDVAVEDYRAQGYLPAALINFCALLGWHPVGDKEILALDEIIKEFKYENIGTSPSVFDTDKLDYFNGYYIRQLPIDKLYELCQPFLADNLARTNAPRKKSAEFIKAVIGLEQERLKKLFDIAAATEFFFLDKLEYETDLLIWKKLTHAEIKLNLGQVLEVLKTLDEHNWTREILETRIIGYIKEYNLKTGDCLWPMRVALTGRQASPGPFEVAAVLGKAESEARVKTAITRL